MRWNAAFSVRKPQRTMQIFRSITEIADAAHRCGHRNSTVHRGIRDHRRVIERARSLSAVHRITFDRTAGVLRRAGAEADHADPERCGCSLNRHRCNLVLPFTRDSPCSRANLPKCSARRCASWSSRGDTFASHDAAPALRAEIAGQELGFGVVRMARHRARITVSTARSGGASAGELSCASLLAALFDPFHAVHGRGVGKS